MSEIIFNPPKSAPSLESQIDSLQTTLASLNQQVIILQETIQEKDQQIAELKNRPSGNIEAKEPKVDNTLTIVVALINLYKFVFPARKA
ncbi:hypothetical protein HYU93_01305 [Candidatus Daviesbacteria bacterium]|nr:hypothetical protein [Candidatus Daviesbacteria bacterium]